MSVKCNDRQGRWRNRTVAFRASDAEVRELDALVALSGLSKQDYIMSRLLERDVVVVPSSRVQRALEDVSRDILIELRRINDARELPLEFREVMQVLARTLEGLGGVESVPETAVAEAAMTSWLVLDLALAVSSGRPFWGYATRQCGVFYLALEDTLSRIQGRMWELSDTASECLYFAINSRGIADGLMDQLGGFVDSHSDTGLVMIDTLQKVRTQSRDNAYAADYGDVSALKGFADANGLAVLVVHHTRKMGDADVLNTVSGTTGITGSADSIFVLTKQGRASEYATLSITGRDIEFQELKLRFNDCRWELVEKTSAEELAEREMPECVLQVVGFMEGRDGEWRGSAARLMEESGVEGIGASVFGKRLAQHSGFLAGRGIDYSRAHSREGSVLCLKRFT